MAHTKVYGICENKCQVQTVAGYASLAALDNTFTAQTPLTDIFQAMDDNTQLTYGFDSCSSSDGVYPITVTPAASTSRGFVVNIDKTSAGAAVMFRYIGKMYICDIYVDPLGVHASAWVRVV